ncbi:hypothetical protein VZT92_026418 [Zoarces viviparus]|uniref:Uncharacterized protein n=1 Tax=Zoarces viviparus TaxID=48416 RepID=A0AAW1DZZ4_ZOAVI
MRRGFPLLPPDVKRVSRFRFARHSPRRRRSLGLPSACTGDLPADLSLPVATLHSLLPPSGAEAYCLIGAAKPRWCGWCFQVVGSPFVCCVWRAPVIDPHVWLCV